MPVSLIGQDKINISNPFDVEHITHVDFDSATGFTVSPCGYTAHHAACAFFTFFKSANLSQGLPPEWEAQLQSSGIEVERANANPERVLDVLQFAGKYYKKPTEGEDE